MVIDPPFYDEQDGSEAPTISGTPDKEIWFKPPASVLDGSATIAEIESAVARLETVGQFTKFRNIP